MLHPLRHKIPAIVILSVAGMPDEGHFKALSAHANYLFAAHGRRLAAEIYRPACRNDDKSIFPGEIKRDTRCHKAGRTGIGRLHESLPGDNGRITQPISDAKSFAEMGNLFWKTCIADGVTPKEFGEKKMVPRPDSLDSFMMLFPFGLNSEAAVDRKVMLQFRFSGEVEESCYFTIEKNKINSEKGISENPDITIETPFNVWMDIMTRKADGQKMFMEQKYKVTGDISLMIKLFEKKADR